MILGFFGKGGSGKSTVATQMVFYSKSIKKKILAIDADHNIDLAYNLAKGDIPVEMNYIGESSIDIKKYLGFESEIKYSEIFDKDTKTQFRIGMKDAFTQKYTYKIDEGVDLMVSGYKTEKVLHEKACSHSLSAPLKVYLPLLDLGDNEVVIVDEKAGADGVTTGIVSGIDVAVIVCEPALHSVKAAIQIAELMDFYGTPYLFVGNKIEDDQDVDFIKSHISNTIITFLPINKSLKQNPSGFDLKNIQSYQNIFTQAEEANTHDRLERTILKYKKNKKVQL